MEMSRMGKLVSKHMVSSLQTAAHVQDLRPSLKTSKSIAKTGVYVVKSTIENKTIFGMMNIGSRPTVNGKHQTIEVHFFDFNQDLYGKHLTVALLYFLRDEHKFDAVSSLVQQLKKDEETARNYIKTLN